MRADHDDDPAIAAWEAYSAAHMGYAEAHGNPDEHDLQAAHDGAEEPASGRRAGEDVVNGRQVAGAIRPESQRP